LSPSRTITTSTTWPTPPFVWSTTPPPDKPSVPCAISDSFTMPPFAAVLEGMDIRIIPATGPREPADDMAAITSD
jgi:hypothetical protein